MRPSQKSAVIEAAVSLADEYGLGGVTLEAAANRAGMTKGGVQYHFHTKQSLLMALADHLVERWEVAMLTALGGPLEEATAGERIRAYVRVVADPGQALSRAGVAVASEAWYSDDLVQPWIQRLGPWFDLEEDLDPVHRARLTAVRLAADGLWSAEVAGVLAPSSADRDALVEHLIAETYDGGVS